jgi:hypothetical protein
MNPLIIVTSAVETRFGIYSPDQRIEMTIATINNLRERIPNVQIAISEVSGNGLKARYEDRLMNACDYFLDFTTNHDVKYIYNNKAWYNNWDIVKNLTELSTFPKALKVLVDTGDLKDIDRVFKMSGRYLLNEKFDIDFYSTPEAKDKIIIGKRYPSQFPYEVTLLREQYMARLLSWPIEMHSDMIQYYITACDYMKSRMQAGGYADIEHCLFYAFPKDRVLEIEEVGVYGNIAPNGAPIVN